MPAGAPVSAAEYSVIARSDAAGRRRLIALSVAIAAIGLLGAASWMTPAAEGHGTHTQLGLPPCQWPALYGMPCPTCGMTTAFAYAVDGDLAASFMAQPMGFLLAIVTAAALLSSLYVLATGSAIGGLYLRLWNRGGVWCLVAGLLLSWGFKVLQFRGVF
jgi:hypothetical protein